MGGGDSYWVMADIAERGAKTDACIPDKCIPQNKSAPHKDARCSASSLSLMSWRTASWRMENLQIFGGLVLGCIETKFCKQILNMRLAAFFKIYKICTLPHRGNLRILAKSRFENQQFS